MKFFNKILFSIISILFLSAIPTAKSTYILSKDYIVSIHGTSNLHAWDEKVGIVSGNGSVNWNNDESFDLETLSIRLNVSSIKSDMGFVMNNNTYKALKADKNPEIIFSLNVPLRSIQIKSTVKNSLATGNLTIAGITKSVDMKVKISMKEDRQLTFEGSETIKMTDYGINPPTALFGTLKTGDEITINFKTNFKTTGN